MHLRLGTIQCRKSNIVGSRIKIFERLGGPLGEIVIIFVHRYDAIKQRHNMIREIRNHCDAGLLYSQIYQYISTLTHHCLDLVS